MSFILGISSFYHDSSAALIKESNIIAAAQEERFTRIKHDNSFPVNSIKYMLKENNLTISDLDAIVFYEKPFLKFERLLETYLGFAPKGIKSFMVSMPKWLSEKLFQKSLIFNKLKELDKNFNEINKIKFSEHHLSHAASAYYPSPFQESLILTIDGVGEWATTSIGIGRKNKIEIIKEIHFPHSIGLLYSAFTYYLGFKVNSGEYKVMGLAPYGKPVYREKILKNLIFIKQDGSFKMNMDYFDYATGLHMTNKKFNKLFGQEVRDAAKQELSEFHMNIAASVQSVIEEIIIRIAINIKEEFKIDNLCMSGGVALNCVANGKIIKNKIFKNLWVQPASGDAGGSLGAALAYWHNELNNSKINYSDNMKGSYLGPKYENDYIEKKLCKIGANFEKLETDNMLDIITNELINKKAIGWFQGRMEFGPRALGARSIIADPRSDTMQKNLNLKVKFRESFRPFAPAVLREKLSDYFNLDQDSPYMLLVTEIKDEIKIEMNKKNKELFGIEKLNVKRSSIPAVTHVDYSARIQTVHEKTNKKFYDLISLFYKKTNCPILINTSFNVRGEPIVNDPEDAFKCFMGTNLDILVIENYILYKENQNKNLIIDYKNKFTLD